MVTPAPDVSGINGIGKLFELDTFIPEDYGIPQEPAISILAPNTGIKGSVSAQSLMDVTAPDLQLPNDSPSITTAAPTLQVFPDSKNVSGSEE